MAENPVGAFIGASFDSDSRRTGPPSLRPQRDALSLPGLPFWGEFLSILVAAPGGDLATPRSRSLRLGPTSSLAPRRRFSGATSQGTGFRSTGDCHNLPGDPGAHEVEEGAIRGPVSSTGSPTGCLQSPSTSTFNIQVGLASGSERPRGLQPTGHLFIRRKRVGETNAGASPL